MLAIRCGEAVGKRQWEKTFTTKNIAKYAKYAYQVHSKYNTPSRNRCFSKIPYLAHYNLNCPFLTLFASKVKILITWEGQKVELKIYLLI